MNLTEYKRKWTNDRVDELRASGLTDAAIARRMKISPAWFHQAMNKPTVGDRFIAKLSEAFGVVFTLPGQLSDDLTKPEPTYDPALVRALLQRVEEMSKVIPEMAQTIKALDEERRSLQQQLNDLRKLKTA